MQVPTRETIHIEKIFHLSASIKSYIWTIEANTAFWKNVLLIQSDHTHLPKNHKIDELYRQKQQENHYYNMLYSLLLGIDHETYELQSIHPIQVTSLIK